MLGIHNVPIPLHWITAQKLLTARCGFLKVLFVLSTVPHVVFRISRIYFNSILVATSASIRPRNVTRTGVDTILDVLQNKQKSWGMISGEHGGHAIGPSRPNHIAEKCLCKRSLTWMSSWFGTIWMAATPTPAGVVLVDHVIVVPVTNSWKLIMADTDGGSLAHRWWNGS